MDDTKDEEEEFDEDCQHEFGGDHISWQPLPQNSVPVPQYPFWLQQKPDEQGLKLLAHTLKLLNDTDVVVMAGKAAQKAS